jgi:dTDP-4-dehydrorhamnose reductase
MAKYLVTGSLGQLGSELNLLSANVADSNFTFVDKAELDITDAKAVEAFFNSQNFDCIINCAAYTAVDKAESEKEIAMKVNADAAGYLAKASKKSSARFIHISTDFVFGGVISRPLLEDDDVNPLSVYGVTKLEGEKQVLKYNPDSVIIRTAWVYSSFGANFVKTILRLCKEKESLNIIYDQIGSPTYARDLAAAILQIMGAAHWSPGIYNYTNDGVASWYDFAIAIRDLAGLKTVINPIETSQYPTPATRPKYSVLNKRKIKETFGIKIPYWRDSLVDCLALIK